MTARAYPSRISKKSASFALANLLCGCTAERLGSFTASGLAAMYNVPAATVEKMLGDARRRRGL